MPASSGSGDLVDRPALTVVENDPRRGDGLEELSRCGLPMTEPPEFGDCVVSSRPPLLYEYRVMENGNRRVGGEMVRPGDRRPMITDHAIVVLADGGARALTHQAVDRHAGLPAGSTSYYFRTRAALIAAVVERIRVHSRTAFDNAQAQSAGPVTAEERPRSSPGSCGTSPGNDGTRRSRCSHCSARHEQPELRDALMRCLFLGRPRHRPVRRTGQCRPRSRRRRPHRPAHRSPGRPTVRR